jgi:hypothetical protein
MYAHAPEAGMSDNDTVHVQNPALRFRGRYPPRSVGQITSRGFPATSGRRKQPSRLRREYGPSFTHPNTPIVLNKRDIAFLFSHFAYFLHHDANGSQIGPWVAVSPAQTNSGSANAMLGQAVAQRLAKRLPGSCRIMPLSRRPISPALTTPADSPVWAMI